MAANICSSPERLLSSHRSPTVDPIRVPDTQTLISLEQQALEHLWFHVTRPEALKTPGGLIVFMSGDGCYLTDIHGRTYLNGLSGWRSWPT